MFLPRAIVYLHPSYSTRVSHKSGAIGNVGMLIQLLQNILSMPTIHAYSNPQSFCQLENSVNCLWHAVNFYSIQSGFHMASR